MTLTEFNPRPIACPRCGNKTVRWDHASRQLRCYTCHASGFTVDEALGEEPISPASTEEITATTVSFWYETLRDGTKVRHMVKHEVPIETDPPNVMFDPLKAGFVKWRLKNLIRKEKRWGRDYLRRQLHKDS